MKNSALLRFIFRIQLSLMSVFIAVLPLPSVAAELPGEPKELVASYRYLEAKSHEFTEKFDQSENPMSERNYAALIATRVLREKIAHQLATILLRKPDSPESQTVLADIKPRDLKGSYISSLPLVDDLLKAVSHAERSENQAKVSSILEKVYPMEARGELEVNWGKGEAVSQARQAAKTYTGQATLERMIATNASQLVEDVVLPKARKPAAAVRYEPSPGSNGNLTGREFATGLWALTYDDGPAKPTAQILDELKTRQLTATFFWLSKNASVYQTTTVARAKSERHGLDNHSATHLQITKLSTSGMDREIIQSTVELERIYGQKLGFFRLPYGSGVNNKAIRDRIAQAGLIHVYWNVDSLDWQDRNPDSVFNRTMKQVAQQGRGIILFHDIHAQTVKASRRVMDELRSQKARVVTMSEAVAELNRGAP